MKTNQIPLVALIAGFLLIIVTNSCSKSSGQEKISASGEYQGYSEKVFDSHVRYSNYLSLSDGTRLAYDLILPAKNDIPATEPLPVLFKYTPYLRTFTIFNENGKNIMADLYDLTLMEKIMLRVRYWIYDRGHLMDPLFRTPWLEDMIYHGYAVVVVERPGTGASFGRMDPSFKIGAKEADEILDWIADQSWSDGNIGMFGDSWQAQIQFAAASTGNPHLKALFPISSSMDNYTAVIYPGGVYNETFGNLFSQLTSLLEALVTPVDSDSDGKLLVEVLEERNDATVGQESANVFETYQYRDMLNSKQQRVWEDIFALYPMLDQINHAGVPVYLVNGWYDLFTKDMFLWYANLSSQKRMVVLPYDHSQLEGENSDFDIGAEAHRWFDYWLKGINNGIMEEPSLYYSLLGISDGLDWETAEQWPLADSIFIPFYFSAGTSGTVSSINDGYLSTSTEQSSNNRDEYVIDYSTTSGTYSRWSAVNWSHDYPDMTSNDQKALTYTSSPLESTVQVIGHPLVHLWLATSAPDLDVFVYLEEVTNQGKSNYITEGNLRASHRLASTAPYISFGLPYFNHYQSELSPLSAWEPVELVFDLQPTAYQLEEGSRIRVTITFSDHDNFDTPILDPPPEIHILRDPEHTSFIDLPIKELP